MKIRSATLTAMAALFVVPTLAAAQTYQQPSGSPLSSIFSCQTSGNKQAGGAVIGGLLGGLIGNKVADNERGLGTVLGAAAGAAAGSYVGCRMQTSDQQRAQVAAQDALNRGQDGSWTNPETGAYGRVSMVSSQGYNQQQYADQNYRYDQNGAYDDRSRYDERSRYDRGYDETGYDQPMSLQNVRFASGVQRQSAYFQASDQYSSQRTVNIRSMPSASGRIVSQTRAGMPFQVLARVRGQSNDWLLVGANNIAIGYVSAAVVQPVYDGRYDRYADRDGAYRDRSGQQSYSAQPLCRTFDQSVTMRDGQSQVTRYTACQTASGEWVVQG